MEWETHEPKCGVHSIIYYYAIIFIRQGLQELLWHVESWLKQSP